MKHIHLSLFLLLLVTSKISIGAELREFSLLSDFLDIKKNTFEYKGNAVYKEPGLALSADRIMGVKNTQGDFESLTATGSPVIFTQTDPKSGDVFVLKAGFINYSILKSELTAKNNALLQQTSKNKDSIQINSEQMTISNESSKKRIIEAVGHPLILSILEKGKKDLTAEATELAFNSSNSDLKLTGEVLVKQEHGTISAGTFKYNRETKISSFEKSSNKQIEIIQTQKPLQ